MVEVERILLTDWDPSGVNGVPMAESEYSTYAGILTSMLVHGSNEDVLADYLAGVEARLSQAARSPQRCKDVAHKCHALLA
jgi:hypothetical protein